LSHQSMQKGASAGRREECSATEPDAEPEVGTTCPNPSALTAGKHAEAVSSACQPLEILRAKHEESITDNACQPVDHLATLRANLKELSRSKPQEAALFSIASCDGSMASSCIDSWTAGPEQVSEVTLSKEIDERTSGAAAPLLSSVGDWFEVEENEDAQAEQLSVSKAMMIKTQQPSGVAAFFSMATPDGSMCSSFLDSSGVQSFTQTRERGAEVVHLIK